MSSGNGTIDYDVEAHTLDAHKTSAARQESTTRNLQYRGIFLAGYICYSQIEAFSPVCLALYCSVGDLG